MPKKKTFVDSTFYADPEGKYPTLEEQVSLAQTVAQSIMLPRNVESRGHRMFVRMRQRARAWTIGATQEELAAALAELDFSHADTIRFYQENPWAARLTKQVGGQQQHLRDEVGRDVPLPPPMTVHSSALFAPNLKASMTPEQIDALSADEYERVVVMQEAEKLQGKASSKQQQQQPVCFRFSDDLRQMKGKGARLFAARQAKAESWATSDGSSPSGQRAGLDGVVVPPSENRDSEKNLPRDKVCFTPHTSTVFTTEDQSSGVRAEPGSPVTLKFPPDTLPKSAGTHVEKDRRTIITISFPPSSSTGIVETTSTETEEKKSLSDADATCRDGLDSAQLISLGRSDEEPSTVPVVEEQHPSEESKQQLPSGDTKIHCEETVTSRLPEAETFDEVPLFSSSAHSTEGPIGTNTDRPIHETPKHSANNTETV